MVMGEPFRLPCSEARKCLFEDSSDPRMQLLSSAACQRTMRDVLQQGVLEDVFGVRRDAAAENDARRDERVQRGFELLAWQRRYGDDQLMRELAPEGGAELR